MSTEPNWEETGLDNSQFYSQEALEKFWLRYDPSLFVAAIRHEMKEQIIVIENTTKFMKSGAYENLDFPCDRIIHSQESLVEIIDLFYEYFNRKLDS